MNLAPVIIVTLNRYDHFKRCIESLKANTFASETPLYIGLDYPSKESHWNGYKKILNYIHNISGFKSVDIIIRQENMGAIPNMFSMFDLVTNFYDRYIFTEDDNIFSVNFLEYINNGLELYKNNPKISAICGYNFPVDKEILGSELGGRSIFFSRFFSAWGYGSWKDRYISRKNKCSLKYCIQIAYSPRQLINLYKTSNRLILDLISILNNKNATDDTTICFNNINDDTYCVLPAVSKVRNIGNDGSGLNCHDLGPNSIFDLQEIDLHNRFDYNILDQTSISEYFEPSSIKKYFDATFREFIIASSMFLIKAPIKALLTFIKLKKI